MKRIAILLCGVLCGAALAQAPDLSKMDIVEKSVPAGPVALVDGQPISGADYLNLYKRQVDQLSKMAGPDKMTDELRLQTGVETIRRMIRERILLNEAAKRGLSVTDAEVQAEYNKQLADMQAMVMEETKETLTEQQFLERIGMTRDEVLASAKEDMLLGKVREALLAKTNTDIPDADVKKFYDNNKDKFAKPGGIHIKQIFIRPEGGDQAGPKAWEAAQKAADNALARFRAGEQFEKVATEVSNAPDKDRGGHVIVPSLDNLPPFYRAPLAKMKVGDLSEIIKSDHGYHFFVYVSNKEEETVPMEQAEDRIRGLLSRVKEEDSLDDYLRPIEMDPNRVEVYLDIEKNLPASMRQQAGAPASAQ